MVAITVILAAVIGAFVLEIGDQQETAPNTSFDSEQRNHFFDGMSGGTLNATRVEFSHAGGDVIDITSADIVVEGNDSVWGVQTETSSGPPRLTVQPQPDLTQTLGTNQQVEFRSGRSWETFIRGGEMSGSWYKMGLPGDDNVQAVDPPSSYYFMTIGSEAPEYVQVRPENVDMPTQRGGAVSGKPFATGDQMQIVWTASSGGKTQTLFKYTVQ
jgi:hypothetical protein